MTIKILLADDHAVLRDGLRHILETQDDIHVIGEAPNGLAAVEETIRLKPDVVVMDISMPVLNGTEATEKIVVASPDTKTVILSIHATSEHVYRALRAGAIGYVLKESAGREVVKAVRMAAVGQRYLSEKIMTVIQDTQMFEKVANDTKSPLEMLSEREREVLKLVVEGRSSQEIADLKKLSVKTVETYRSRITTKLGIKDIPSLVKFSIKHGITDLE